jgi:rhodanese-related sulfurtransferase
MKDFSVIEFATYLKNNQPLLLDVREQWEWDKCHFENSKLLPMGQIMSNIEVPQGVCSLPLISHITG